MSENPPKGENEPKAETPLSSPDRPVTPTGDDRPRLVRRMVDAVRYGNSAVLTLLALIVAMAVGAVLIAVADPDTRAASQYFFTAPLDTLSAAGRDGSGGHAALFLT